MSQLRPSAQAVIQQIAGHIARLGGEPGCWYAGRTADMEDRLFFDHGVPINYCWIYRTCKTASEAKTVEHALLELGCDGDPTHSKNKAYIDEDAVVVYAYQKIAGVTRP